MTDPALNITNDQTGGTADNLDSELASLPQKYQGKSPAEIAKMHMEAEKLASRLGSELGEWRNMANSLVGVQQEKAKKPEPRKAMTPEEVLTDPEKAVNEAIENHPAVKGAKEAAEELKRTQALSQIEKEFPNFRDDLVNEDFMNWVTSSKARSNLAIQANNYDIDAARDLLSLWADHKSITAAKKEQEKETKKQVRNERVSALTLEGRSGAQIDTSVRFNRAEMVDLQRRANSGDKSAQAKWNDPVFQKARLQAYKDGRVD